MFTVVNTESLRVITMYLCDCILSDFSFIHLLDHSYKPKLFVRYTVFASDFSMRTFSPKAKPSPHCQSLIVGKFFEFTQVEFYLQMHTKF